MAAILHLATGVNVLEVWLKPPVLYIWLVAAFLALLVAFVRSPLFRGWVGEFQVNLMARLLFDRSTYHLVRNITLPCEDGTTQIDHVIVSRHGVFVIETKNMSGWIFGGAGDATWTQKFPRSSNRFQNPLRQNYKHTATLVELLGLPADSVRSVIVFIGDAKLKGDMPPNVTIGSGFLRYIKSHKDDVLTDEQVRSALEAIEQQRLAPDLRTHMQHVHNVQERAAEKQDVPESIRPVSQSRIAPSPPTEQTDGNRQVDAAPEQAPAPTCPKCGRPMLLRTARKGPNAGKPFWGCSGFPECRTVLQCQ